jgi:hypothetical protein
MKDWKRMCNAMGQEDEYTACDKCDLRSFGCPAIYENECNNADWNHVESVVTSWAAEHPEPVYPSIAKYLERFGILIRRDGSLEADYFKANEPMGEDLAKLLGIDLEKDAK